MFRCRNEILVIFLNFEFKLPLSKYFQLIVLPLCSYITSSYKPRLTLSFDSLSTIIIDYPRELLRVFLTLNLIKPDEDFLLPSRLYCCHVVPTRFDSWLVRPTFLSNHVQLLCNGWKCLHLGTLNSFKNFPKRYLFSFFCVEDDLNWP